MNNQIQIEFCNETTNIHFVENLKLNDYFDKTRTILITDNNVYSLYNQLFNEYDLINVDNGEECKNISNVELIINKLLEKKVDRSFELVAIGGGAVCDLTGYIASIYMRGLKHSFVPTTLLAMVDASIGGKTAVNFNNIKNIIGTFKHPSKILVYNQFIKTLSREEFYSGLAELIKIALIADEELFEMLEVAEYKDVMPISYELLSRAIMRKAEIVLKDERDISLRQVLNFGHTFGHIIEVENSIPHGLAVFKGMKLALDISLYINKINDATYHCIIKLIDKYDICKVSINYNNMINKVVTDKKREKDSINLILLNDIAKPIINNVNIADLNDIFNSFVERKLCVSVSNINNIDDIFNSIDPKYLIEYRVDKAYNINEIRQIVDKYDCIISYKLSDSSDPVEIYKNIIELKPKYIDIDYNLGRANLPEIIELASDYNVGTIISYHDSNSTPEESDLIDLLNDMKLYNTYIIKIVTKCKSDNDVIKLKNLYKHIDYNKLIAFSLDDEYRQTRIDAVKYGSPFMYIFHKAFGKTADGQFNNEEIYQLMEVTF